MNSDESGNLDDRIKNENLSTQNRILGAKTAGDYLEIFILCLGLAALIFSIALPGGYYIVDYTKLNTHYPHIYKLIIIAGYLFSLLIANRITKKNYPKRYEIWTVISTFLIFVSFLTNFFFAKSVF